MKLDETVNLMLGDDYKDRFVAEYGQVVNRANKLRKVVKILKRRALMYEDIKL